VHNDSGSRARAIVTEHVYSPPQTQWTKPKINSHKNTQLHGETCMYRNLIVNLMQ